MEKHDGFLSAIEQHRGILYKVASAYCPFPQREDLVQEIVIALWRSYDRYDARRPFGTWMYRVALNVAISFYRREIRRSAHFVTVEPLVLESVGTQNEPDADERLELLEASIERLDELNKALVLLYLDGNSYETIAEILGISVTNVATKLSRIKKTLKRGIHANQ